MKSTASSTAAPAATTIATIATTPEPIVTASPTAAPTASASPTYKKSHTYHLRLLATRVKEACTADVGMAHHSVAQLIEQSSLSMAPSTPSTPEHSKSYRPPLTKPFSQTRLSVVEHLLTAPETSPSRPFAGEKLLLTSPPSPLSPLGLRVMQVQEQTEHLETQNATVIAELEQCHREVAVLRGLLTGTGTIESRKMNTLAFDIKEAREHMACKLKLCKVEVELVASQETANVLQMELHRLQRLQRREVERQDADDKARRDRVRVAGSCCDQRSIALEKLSKMLEREVHARKIQSSQTEHLETQNATLIAELEQCRRETEEATSELQTTVNVKMLGTCEQEKEEVDRMLDTASDELLTLRNQVMSNTVSTDLFKAELSESHATATYLAKKNQELVLEANGYKKDLTLALEKQLRAECSLAQHSTDWNAERIDLLSRAKKVVEVETTLARTKTELSELEARVERDGKEAAEAECTRLTSLVEHADRNIKDYVTAGEESAREIERLCAALEEAETATLTLELSNAKIFALVGTSERTMVLAQSELKKSMMEVTMLQRQLETSEQKLALTQSELKEFIGNRWRDGKK